MSLIKIKFDPTLVRVIQNVDGAVFLAERIDTVGYVTLTDPRSVYLPTQVRDFGTLEELVVSLRHYELLAKRLTTNLASDLSTLLNDFNSLLKGTHQ